MLAILQLIKHKLTSNAIRQPSSGEPRQPANGRAARLPSAVFSPPAARRRFCAKSAVRHTAFRRWRPGRPRRKAHTSTCFPGFCGNGRELLPLARTMQSSTRLCPNHVLLVTCAHWRMRRGEADRRRPGAASPARPRGAAGDARDQVHAPAPRRCRRQEAGFLGLPEVTSSADGPEQTAARPSPNPGDGDAGGGSAMRQQDMAGGVVSELEGSDAQA